MEHFRLYVCGKPIELLTDHQALKPLTKRNRSNKTYSARLTRWLDRLAHFDINIKHIAGKHLKLTDYLSRNPISKLEPIEKCDEDHVINCVIPLLNFFNTHVSITDEKKLEAQTDEVAALANSQSQSRSVNKIQLSENEQNKQWSLKFSQGKVRSNTADTNQTVQNRMDIKTIECIEKDYLSEETLRLTTRWKEITKPGDYRFTQGQWKKYNPSRALGRNGNESKLSCGREETNC